MMKLTAPLPNENPALYADRVGEWYAGQTTAEHKSEHGQYLTPPAVAMFMGRLATSPSRTVRILDPGAGSGTLSCAICEALTSQANKPSRIELMVYETESGLLKHLSAVLEYLKGWLAAGGTDFSYTIRATDFILDNAVSLGVQQKSLFTNCKPEHFDYIISNPPYFKVQKDDPRAKACMFVVHGQPNIYALFMAASAYLLKPQGQLIYITPRSFAAGPYFRLFREKFFNVVRPIQVHLFGSRTETFTRNEVLQEHVILHAVRDEGWATKQKKPTVLVSFSAGVKDIEIPRNRIVPMLEIIDMASHNKFFHIPTSDEEQAIIHLVNSWPGNLHKYEMEISTGPVVPFRATEFITNDNGSGKVPLLWMQNVKPLATTWPVSMRKQQYIVSCDGSLGLLLPNRNYVLLRRFSAKEEHRRLTASPYLSADFSFKLVGFENHLNYIYRRGEELSRHEAFGIAALLNCKLLDTYFRSFNGNTQVSATELRSIPLPPLETIQLIGKEAAKGKLSNGELDSWITEMLMQSQGATSVKNRRRASNPAGAGAAARSAK